MDRRAFLAGWCLFALAAPRVACTQDARKVRRIGVLSLSSTPDLVGPNPRSATVGELIDGLRALGYSYGEHFVTEPFGSEGKPERFPVLVAELVRRQVDIIVATGAALPALQQATSTIPVVMAATSEPVAQGYVRALGRPGGNITGLSLQSIETTGKRLELLKELVPGVAPVAVLWNSASLASLRAAETAALERSWSLLPLEIQDLTQLEGLFKAATGAGAGALLVVAVGDLFPNARHVADLAAKYRLPAMYELQAYVEAGGLIAYGPDINDIWRRSAGFVDKILKGTKPADLPVEQPSKFQLVVNLKAAKTLGLKIPPSVLLRADQVIQ
jgi:putative ABC transport system substrate-binding protein